MNIKILTVSKLNGYIKNLLSNDVILNNVSVEGELSNVKIHSSGHIYFSLKDNNSIISCIMFKSNAQYLDFNPADGVGVTVRGYVSVYEKTGQYQLYVQQIKMYGQGNLYQKFEQLKEDLRKRGWFDSHKKKELPTFPESVAVITSPTGAAVRDIVSVLRRRNPSIKIYLVPVLVQGENAKYEIVKAIETVNEASYADVIILGRGGGSIEELWAFNEEIVAKSIYNSLIPVISAVGHETDFTISDFVADLRAPTPSAAAEIVTLSMEELKDKLHIQKGRVVRSLNNKIYNYHKILMDYKNNYVIRRPSEKLNKYRQQLDYNQNILIASINKKIQNYRKQVFDMKVKINDIKVKDYGKIYDNDGRRICSIKDVNQGELINIKLKDGIIISRIIDINEGERI